MYVLVTLKDETLKHKRWQRFADLWHGNIYLYKPDLYTVFGLLESHVGFSQSDFQHGEGKNASKQRVSFLCDWMCVLVWKLYFPLSARENIPAAHEADVQVREWPRILRSPEALCPLWPSHTRSAQNNRKGLTTDVHSPLESLITALWMSYMGAGRKTQTH